MFNRNKRYINLIDRSSLSDRQTGIRIIPENRVTELSGKKWRWIWNRPKGILLQRGGSEKRFPIIDLTQILEAFLYGVSLILVMIGIKQMFGSQSGD